MLALKWFFPFLIQNYKCFQGLFFSYMVPPHGTIILHDSEHTQRILSIFFTQTYDSFVRSKNDEFLLKNLTKNKTKECSNTTENNWMPFHFDLHEEDAKCCCHHAWEKEKKNDVSTQSSREFQQLNNNIKVTKALGVSPV